MTNDKIQMSNESINDKLFNYLDFNDLFGFWDLDFGIFKQKIY